MTTLEAPASSEQGHTAAAVTWGWVLKRSALWVAILASGIICACWLYAAASPDAASNSQMNAPASVARGVYRVQSDSRQSNVVDATAYAKRAAPAVGAACHRTSRVGAARD